MFLIYVVGRSFETLTLFDYPINEVEPNFQRFPCLTSLSLCRVQISVEELNSLLSAFPKLERLELSKPILRTGDDKVHSHDMTLKLHCPTFKSLILNELKQLEFILDDGFIECVDVYHSFFGLFKVSGGKRLRHFKFFKSEAHFLDFEEGGDLEVLECIACHVLHSNLFPMKIHAPKLKTLRVWGFSEQPDFGFDIEELIHDRPFATVDFDQIAARVPELTHLAVFCYDDVDFGVTLGGLSSLENAVLLELGWKYFNNWEYFDSFWEWAEEVLKYCPNVRKLIVYGMLPKCQDEVFLERFAKYTTSMVEMVRKYQHIEVQISYLDPDL
ncbi:unnamed protein product [Cuscuta campestris]|uniref:F-box/LRR-repeat protein 15/At3g58940/PEG3-like LRR domain-containing protein n=1 Tax=Cuscuta campestris TaxID=132261 RepID=A0A484LXV6_9ASTE|nr:unnamed protein product [Cuscuta campestris]